MARLLAEGCSREAVCEELGISRETFYRDKRSGEYADIVKGLRGPAVEADHPDVVAARVITARTELTIAEKVERGVSLGLDTIVEMMQAPENHRLGEVVAATKFLLEQHQARVGTGAEDDAPLTAAEVAEVRKMTGAA
jgi:hypothetical protein